MRKLLVRSDSWLKVLPVPRLQNMSLCGAFARENRGEADSTGCYVGCAVRRVETARGPVSATAQDHEQHRVQQHISRAVRNPAKTLGFHYSPSVGATTTNAAQVREARKTPPKTEQSKAKQSYPNSPSKTATKTAPTNPDKASPIATVYTPHDDADVGKTKDTGTKAKAGRRPEVALQKLGALQRQRSKNWAPFRGSAPKTARRPRPRAQSPAGSPPTAARSRSGRAAAWS